MITAARNVREGFGLTRHASEPYVQSFTSPVSVLIPIVGELFHQKLLLLPIGIALLLFQGVLAFL